MMPDEQRAVVEDDDDTDWETEARAEGWAPESEWQGTPPKHGFMSAKDFVKRGREVLPIVQAKNRRLEGEIASLKSSLTEVQSSAARFNQFAQAAIERERREKIGLIEQLEQRRAQAITEGDGQTAVAAERRIGELKALPEMQAAPPSQPEQFTEEQLAPAKRFLAANAWYEKDPDLRDWADARAVRLRNSGVQSGQPIFDKVAQQVREAFPHKFQGNGSSMASVEGAGRRQPEQFGKRTFDDLPEEHKREYDNAKKANPRLTHKEWLSYYEWD